jgi:hypothetical protein
MIYQLQLTALGHLKFKGQERFVSFVVSGKSEDHAREIASEKDENAKEIWLDKNLSRCSELDPNKEVLCCTFLSRFNI